MDAHDIDVIRTYRDTISEAVSRRKLRKAVKTIGSRDVNINHKKYDWGDLMTIEKGMSYSVVLHPEGIDIVKKVIKTKKPDKYKDEQGYTWKISLDDGMIHFDKDTYHIEVPVEEFEATLEESIEEQQDDDVILYDLEHAILEMSDKIYDLEDVMKRNSKISKTFKKLHDDARKLNSKMSVEFDKVKASGDYA